MDGLSADWDQVGCSDLHEKTKAELYAKHFRQSLIQAHNDHPNKANTLQPPNSRNSPKSRKAAAKKEARLKKKGSAAATGGQGRPSGGNQPKSDERFCQDLWDLYVRQLRLLQEHQTLSKPQEATKPVASWHAKVVLRFQSWGDRLQKVQRHNDRATAKHALESEKRADIRAACAAAAAVKAAAEPKLSKPGASGPTLRNLWAEELPGLSAQSKVLAKKAVSLEKGAEHEHALGDKEKLRILQLLEQKEARRKAFEIGGS